MSVEVTDRHRSGRHYKIFAHAHPFLPPVTLCLRSRPQKLPGGQKKQNLAQQDTPRPRSLHRETPKHSQTHTNIDTHTHIHTHTYIHTHTDTRIHTHTHTHTHTQTNEHTHIHTHTHKQTNTHTHTHSHTHTHTHTHTPQTHPVHVHPPRCTKTGENPRHPNLSTPRQTGPSTGSSADLSLTSLNLPAPRPGLPGSSYKTSN